VINLTPKTIPGSIQDYYFDWNKREEPKTKWYIDKVYKKGTQLGFLLLVPNHNGFCQLSGMSKVTGDRMYTFFADCENLQAVEDLNQLYEGAK